MDQTEISKRIQDALKSKVLDFSGLRIIFNLPPEISTLKYLKSINLYKNLLESVPEEILKFTLLEELNLYRNKIKTIPNFISSLSNLKILNLGSNQISELPDDLFQLKNLEELDLSNNELTVIPPSIKGLSRLRDLKLFRNQLKAIAGEIGELENLKKLDLSENQIVNLPSRFGQLKLQVLNVEENPLRSPPIEIVRRGRQAILEYLKSEATCPHLCFAEGTGLTNTLAGLPSGFIIQAVTKDNTPRTAGGDSFIVKIYKKASPDLNNENSTLYVDQCGDANGIENKITSEQTVNIEQETCEKPKEDNEVENVIPSIVVTEVTDETQIQEGIEKIQSKEETHDTELNTTNEQTSVVNEEKNEVGRDNGNSIESKESKEKLHEEKSKERTKKKSSRSKSRSKLSRKKSYKKDGKKRSHSKKRLTKKEVTPEKELSHISEPVVTLMYEDQQRPPVSSKSLEKLKSETLISTAVNKIRLQEENPNYQPNNEETIVTMIIDNYDGSYIVNYVIESHGDYVIDISLYGTPIKGSPFSLHVEPDIRNEFKLLQRQLDESIKQRSILEDENRQLREQMILQSKEIESLKNLLNSLKAPENPHTDSDNHKTNVKDVPVTSQTTNAKREKFDRSSSLKMLEAKPILEIVDDKKSRRKTTNFGVSIDLLASESQGDNEKSKKDNDKAKRNELKNSRNKKKKETDLDSSNKKGKNKSQNNTPIYEPNESAIETKSPSFKEKMAFWFSKVFTGKQMEKEMKRNFKTNRKDKKKKELSEKKKANKKDMENSEKKMKVIKEESSTSQEKKDTTTSKNKQEDLCESNNLAESEISISQYFHSNDRKEDEYI